MSIVDATLKDFTTATKQEWENLFLKEIKATEILNKSHYLGFDFAPFYTNNPALESQTQHVRAIGQNKGTGWHVNARYAFENASNKQILDDLNNGISSLTLEGDFTVKTLEAALNNVLAEYIEINFANCTEFKTIAEAYYNWCVQQKINPNKVNGCLINDPVGDALRNGGWQKSKEQINATLVQLCTYTQKHLPNIKPVCVDASIYHYAGANLAQTIACTLAHAVEYLNILTQQGIGTHDAIANISFQWPVGIHFFAEISAIRALRLLWSNICQHITHSQTVFTAHVHGETSFFYWSPADANNNMLRATTQSMAAIIGGVNTMHVNPYSIFEKTNDTFAERIAKNVQLMLREESFLDKVIDPAGGSSYVEALTEQLLTKALALFKNTEEKGGLIANCENNTIQKTIRENANSLTKAYTENNIKIVGSNLYPNPKQEPVTTIKKLFKEPVLQNTFMPLEPFVLDTKMHAV